MQNADIVKSFLDDLDPDDYPKIQHVKAAYSYIYIIPYLQKRQTKSNKKQKRQRRRFNQ